LRAAQRRADRLHGVNHAAWSGWNSQSRNLISKRMKLYLTKAYWNSEPTAGELGWLAFRLLVWAGCGWLGWQAWTHPGPAIAVGVTAAVAIPVALDALNRIARTLRGR